MSGSACAALADGHVTAVLKRCRILWDYNGTHEDDLSVSAGDIVVIVSRVDAEWTQGTIDGRIGIFPSNYGEELSEEDSPSTNATPLKPKTPTEELLATERAYIQGLKDVREQFFPRLRSLLTAPEAKKFFNNWQELIPCSEVSRRSYSIICPVPN